MVQKSMFKTIRSKETSQITKVTGSKPNKWGYPEYIKHEASRHFRNIN
jgi:hypothetical protein